MRSLAGQRFGRWLVMSQVPSRNKQTYWHCLCDCGTERDVAGNNLPNGASRSCGCLNKEETSRRFRKHGLGGTQEYTLWRSAKVRAQEEKALFELEPTDIVIPDVCPVLGIPIRRGSKLSPWSPSVDRINPRKGYTKTNIWVISFRANVLKNDGSPAEHRQIADALERKLGCAFFD